jgi:short-subunit dehydrogenase
LLSAMEFDRARVLLTGASGGLGIAIASRLAERGARVVLSGRDGARLERVRERLDGTGHVVAPADLFDPAAPRSLLQAAGELDALVSGAGLPASGWLQEYEPHQLSRALRVNLEAPMQIALLMLPGLLARGRGQLVFVSSLAGKVASPGLSIYCATKFGLRGFALALRTELLGSGVGVSVISPGFIRDAGMFAASGADVPPAVGSLTAGQVADRVLGALAADPAEVVAAPRRHRVLAHAMMCAPRLWEGPLSGREAVRSARQIAAGQVSSR